MTKKLNDIKEEHENAQKKSEYISEKIGDGNNNGEVTGEVKQAYKNMFNDNYATYSYIYSSQNNTAPLTLTYNGERCYGVNQYGNMLVYLDGEQHIRVRELDESGNEIGDYPVDFGTDEDFVVDKVIYDGRNIYGIRIDSVNDVAGNIFIASLTVKDDGTYTVKNLYYPIEVYARYLLFKTIVTTNENNEEQYNRYLYYIDYADSEKLKRININTPTSIEVISNGTEELTNVEIFDIYDNYMIYNCVDNEVTIAGFDPFNATVITQIGDKIPVYGVNGMISDSNAGQEDNKIYYIRDNGDGTNTVVGINMSWDSYSATDLSSVSGAKIRNIAIVDGKLYGRINDADYAEIPK